MTMLMHDAVESLQSALRGELVTPDDPNYRDARKVYNGMIDRRPRLIAYCVDTADVIACVNYARDNHLPLSVRSATPSNLMR